MSSQTTWIIQSKLVTHKQHATLIRIIIAMQFCLWTEPVPFVDWQKYDEFGTILVFRMMVNDIPGLGWFVTWLSIINPPAVPAVKLNEITWHWETEDNSACKWATLMSVFGPPPYNDDGIRLINVMTKCDSNLSVCLSIWLLFRK